jgi:hypothetical protein
LTNANAFLQSTGIIQTQRVSKMKQNFIKIIAMKNGQIFTAREGNNE